MVETIVDKEDRDIIWDYWRKDKVLNKRCEHIAKAFEAFISNPNDQTFFESVIADYVLEGLYFYQGFIYFYNLASRALMCGTADMIRYINKDETLHVALYQHILKELPYSTEHGDDWIYDFFETATDLDIKWNQYIIGNNILGITNDSIDKYSKYLCNKRLKGIGLKPIYADISNPYKHLEKLATDTVKTNFFDGTVTTYSQSTALEGWDF
jgi:ribonucleoside-diphosphate reductase beta chain